MHEDVLSQLSKVAPTRRQFVVTTLAAGFALAVRPVSAETITTDAKGLEAGEVKIPVKDGDKEGEMPAYRAMPDWAARSPSSWSSRRFSASTNTSRTSAAASPSSATWPSRRNSSPAKATCPRSPTSRKSSPKWSRKSPTPR